MRVLTVGNMYPPHHQGGYELDWQMAVSALREAGHEARVLTTDHREPGVTDEDRDPEVHRELRWYWKDYEFPRMSWRARLALERHNQRVLDGHLAAFDPDLIAWWPMGGMSLSLVERVHRSPLPAIAVVEDDWLVYGTEVDGWQKHFRHAGGRALGFLSSAVAGVPTPVRLGRAAHWVFCSDSVRRAARTAVPDLAQTAIVPVGLDAVFLDPREPPPWRGRLLAPGRLDARKGQATAVEALALLPEAQLEVVGAGDESYAGELRSLAERLGVDDRFRISAPRPRTELVEAYAASDAVLFPVLWPEPFGLVPLEAMGIGRPVVATGQGGAGEYLRDGENCLLFEPGDAEALAAAVRRLAGDAGLRDRLRAGGQATVPEFARPRWAQRLLAEHERALGTGGSLRSPSRPASRA